MTYSTGSLLHLGEGPFRKVRQAMNVRAFGVNGLVLEPGQEWFEHYHEQQDELYFVHSGTAGFAIEGNEFELGPGGLVHVESTTPRRFWNAGDEDLVLLIVGGAGGYVGRDGQMVHPEDVERRKAVAAGDLGAIARRPS